MYWGFGLNLSLQHKTLQRVEVSVAAMGQNPLYFLKDPQNNQSKSTVSLDRDL